MHAHALNVVAVLLLLLLPCLADDNAQPKYKCVDGQCTVTAPPKKPDIPKRWYAELEQIVTRADEGVYSQVLDKLTTWRMNCWVNEARRLRRTQTMGIFFKDRGHEMLDVLEDLKNGKSWVRSNITGCHSMDGWTIDGNDVDFFLASLKKSRFVRILEYDNEFYQVWERKKSGGSETVFVREGRNFPSWQESRNADGGVVRSQFFRVDTEFSEDVFDPPSEEECPKSSN
mmetsp:Transcript_4690/g.11656  ORF Transcript_4690/g.11656 Transcript_4690/m.11656 type:complete len:229 (-) Transcript_4690:266-952(-)